MNKPKANQCELHPGLDCQPDIDALASIKEHLRVNLSPTYESLFNQLHGIPASEKGQ
jgi:hypothetical protein